MDSKGPGISIRRALKPVIGLFDLSSKAPNQKPRLLEEGTRFPQFPWDLRTIIMVFPPDAPFRFLNLNICLGLTGVPFDQVKRWDGSDPKDAFDLQFCLEGKEGYATYKKYHSITRELKYRPDAVQFELGERLLFEGAWPGYHIRYSQPEDNLLISMRLDSWDIFQWWAYAPGIYCHYTSFASCKMEWQWEGKSGTLDLPALHDHGWGRNLLPLRLPLRVFRYEVLRLPEGGYAISLWTEGPAGLELKSVGLQRPDKKQNLFMDRYECAVQEWDTSYNYAGLPCRVPRRWIGKQRGNQTEFIYEAARNTEPRPILGEGFMYGFDYQGRWTGSEEERIEGKGYVEQLGRFLG